MNICMCGEIWKIVYWEKIWIRNAHLAQMEFCIKVGKFGKVDTKTGLVVGTFNFTSQRFSIKFHNWS